MKYLLIALFALPVACAHAQEFQDNTPSMTTPSCETYHEWTGKNIKDIDLKFLDGRAYRILYPDSMMTMDFSPDRLNINVDENGIIISQECG